MRTRRLFMSNKDKRKYSIHNVKDCGIDYVVVQESADKYGRVEHYEISVNTYDKVIELIYATHKSEALEGLDNIINLLQALRQDVDVTYKD